MQEIDRSGKILNVGSYSFYCDESGGHAGSPVLVIAGWLGEDSWWREFNKDWQAVLDTYGIDSFHMNKFENRKGAYERISGSDRRDLLNGLLRCVTNRLEAGVFGAVNIPAHERMITAGHKQRLGSSYTFCAMVCMDTLRRWCVDNNFDGSIAYVYEAGALHSGEFKDAYDRALKNEVFKANRRHAGFRFGDKTEAPLGAADLLAYEVYKDILNNIGGRPRGMRYPVGSLLVAGFEPYGVYCNEEGLERLVSSKTVQGSVTYLR